MKLQQNFNWTDEKLAELVGKLIVRIDDNVCSVTVEGGSEWRGKNARVITSRMIEKRDRPFRKNWGGKR